MDQVETVRGSVPLANLGATLMHEHIFIKHPELEQNYPNPEWDEDAAISGAADSLQALHRKGIGTLVDLTVMGLGRFIPRIQTLAERLDMHIVVATGYYTSKDLAGYFRRHGPGLQIDMPEPLERMFLTDIEDGIADTGVKAAVIKVVTDEPGVTPDVERVLHSAARVQRQTGVLITTHTHAEMQTGRLQQEYFRKQGVDLERVLIGHCGDSTNLGYLTELMDNGSTIGMDRFGISAYLDDERRTDTVVRLVERGYAGRMILSQDAACYSINSEPSHRQRLEPAWSHHLISDRVLPELRARGVEEAAIEQMMVANPARLLARS